MKLCVPVRVANGLESCIEPHLPNAEHLLILDTETRELQHVSLRDQPAEGGEAPRFDAVLCGSIDSATKAALVEKGILAFGTEARTAGEAIAEFEEANLAAYRSGGCGGGGCCGGHGHEDGHEHGEGGCACAGHGHDDGNVAVVARPLGETFKIAVTSQNRKTVTEHAGKCRKFWVYEIKAGAVVGKQLLELSKDQSLHETAPGEAHPLDEVSVLLTTGFGAGLQQRLARKGIEAMMTEEKTPDAAVEAFLKQLA